MEALLIKHAPDAESVGRPLNEYGACTAILLVSDLRERLRTVGTCENWFGVKIAEWFSGTWQSSAYPVAPKAPMVRAGD